MQTNPPAAPDVLNDPEFQAAINEPVPDLDRIKHMIFQAYAAAAGNPDPDPQVVASWFYHSYGLVAVRGINVERSRQRRVISLNLTRKVQHLMERHCYQCDIYERFKYIRFFIRIPPTSRQASDRAIRAAFRNAVADDLKRKDFDFSDFFDARLCVAITFIMAAGRTKNDTDNLAKNFLDSLEGVAYRDDEQIEHLDLLRLSSRSPETFIVMRVAGTDINGVRDVISSAFPLEWAGSGPIDLEAYIAAARAEEEGSRADMPPA